MMLWAKTKNMYYGQKEEICELDFHGFKIPFFHCNWVDAIKGVVQDKYEFISVDLNHQGYKSEPFVFLQNMLLNYLFQRSHNILDEVLLARAHNGAHCNKHVYICSNGHPAGPAQEAPRGAQDV
jgi:hypothetical protein